MLAMTSYGRDWSFYGFFNLDFDFFVEVVRVALITVTVFWFHSGVDPALCRGLSQLLADCFFFGSLDICNSFLF